MKKLLLSFCLFAFIPQTQAQETSKLNILLGPNLSSVTGDGNDRSPNIGFHGGMQFSYPLANNLTINPAVLFTRHSFKSEYIDMDDELRKSKHYSNLIQQQTYLQKHLSNKIYFGLGYVVSYLASATYKSEGEKMTDAYLGDSKRFDFALATNFGYGLTDKLSSDISFEYGLITQAKSSTYKNNLWILKLNFKYPIWTKK